VKQLVLTSVVKRQTTVRILFDIQGDEAKSSLTDYLLIFDGVHELPINEDQFKLLEGFLPTAPRTVAAPSSSPLDDLPEGVEVFSAPPDPSIPDPPSDSDDEDEQDFEPANNPVDDDEDEEWGGSDDAEDGIGQI
jgi:hypothetical protein